MFHSFFRLVLSLAFVTASVAAASPCFCEESLDGTGHSEDNHELAENSSGCCPGDELEDVDEHGAHGEHDCPHCLSGHCGDMTAFEEAAPSVLAAPSFDWNPAPALVQTAGAPEAPEAVFPGFQPPIRQEKAPPLAVPIFRANQVIRC